jgi:hypothetical protein
MSKEEKELLEKFRKLIPENRTIAQCNLNVALAAQEKRQYGLLPEGGPAREPGGKSAA